MRSTGSPSQYDTAEAMSLMLGSTQRMTLANSWYVRAYSCGRLEADLPRPVDLVADAPVADAVRFREAVLRRAAASARWASCRCSTRPSRAPRACRRRRR